MYLTTANQRRLVTILVALALALSLLLVATVTLDRDARAGEAGTACTPTGISGSDFSYVNPWAAGDAAVLTYLAEIGRDHLNEDG